MALPTVTIIGRPNVGKSSLFNALTRQRISIVDPRAGITRDRISAVVAVDEKYFELVDTGGLGIIDDDQLETHVEAQIRYALQEARLIVFLCDVRDGVTPLDETVAAMLRKLELPVILAANKVDDFKLERELGEFHKLGFGEPLALSAHQGVGRDALLAQIMERLGEYDEPPPGSPEMKLAIVGKRNAGKSTLVNALAGSDRVIVSEIPGTTRDAVDVRFEIDGHSFIAVDTAGVRRRKSMKDIDYYSHVRVMDSVRRADAVLYLIDATVAISEVDLKLTRAIIDEYKPVVLGVNKWDLALGRASVEQYSAYFAQAMPALRYAPLTFLTAATGKNVRAAVEVAQSLFNQATTRATTGRLNHALQLVLEARDPTPQRGSKAIKIYYATQVATAPPTIVLFCNRPEAITDNYRRFVENRLREILPFKEIPIRLLFRARQRSESHHAR